MPKSFPHQKWIKVHKPKVTDRFLQIAHSDWMTANKTLTPFGLQLYLYLASNNDNYEFALSPADAEERAGIKSTSFHKYMKILEEEGYLVWKHGNVFDFYTSPRDPKERTQPDAHSDYIEFEDTATQSAASQDEVGVNAARSAFPPDEDGASHLDSIPSQSIKEIDNRIIDNKENFKERIDVAGTPRTPAHPDAKASELASIGTQQRPPSKYFNDLWYS